jgi:hypothetical protein
MVDSGIKLKERGYLEDLGFDSCTLLMCLSETGSGVVLWIHLAQNVEEWQIAVNTVMEPQAT